MDVPVFVALGSGRTIDAEGCLLPTLVIDASDRPDVADLARVHAAEGVGDIWTEAIRSGDVLVLGIQLTSPVAAAFAIAIDVVRHAEVLAEMVEQQVVVIAHTEPDLVDRDGPLWLAVDLDGDALAACLASG